MRALLSLLCFLWLLPALAQDVDKVNGSIRVAAGQTAGKLSTVNGGIHIEANATVGSAETVNGAISVGDNAKTGHLETVNGAVEMGVGVSAGSVETVNGAVTLGANGRIKDGVETVNGAIILGTNAQVDGSLETVDGHVTLQRGARCGDIETTSGNIDIGPEAQVRSIHIKGKSFGLSKWFGGAKRGPRVVIGPNAVTGDLTFEQEVQLFVSESAKIGKVEGTTVQRFKGERPPG